MANALNLGDIVLPGSGFPDFDTFSIPVWGGLAGAFLFKKGLSAENKVPDSVAAAIVGTPTSGAGFASFTGTSYLQTEIPDGSEMTIIVGCRNVSGPVAYAGNYMGATLGGQTIFSGALKTGISVNGARGAGADGQAALTELPVGWGCYAARIPAVGKNEVHDMFRGTKVLSAGSGNHIISAEKIRVGSAKTAGFEAGACDLSFALIYNRAVSDAELTSIRDWAHGYMKDSGLISS
jgi:hypothetical protein